MEHIIPTAEWEEKFRTHLQHNDRIIFSAKFGDGKSYFLNGFKKKYDDEYLFITIYPIHYQLESDVNILELIKRDIIYQFFKKKLITKSTKLDCLLSDVFSKESLYAFADWIEGIEKFIKFPNLISPLIRTGAKCETLVKGKAKTYVDGFQEQPGIYESDCYTLLIKSVIKNFQEKNPAKKIVLIIEDFDRIDPAHVFRVLNVFSAHIDRHNVDWDLEQDNEEDRGSNKFGFDKVITVCDYRNLKMLFNHVYGEGASFEGYISKFVTLQPFEYALVKVEYAQRWISKISNLDVSFIQELTSLTKALKLLSIREILDLIEHIGDHIKTTNINVFGDYQIPLRCSLTQFLCILIKLLPDKEVLKRTIEKVQYAKPEQTIKLIDVMWGIKVDSLNPTSCYAFHQGRDRRLTFDIIPSMEDGQIVVRFDNLKTNQYIGDNRNDFVEEIFEEMMKYIGL